MCSNSVASLSARRTAKFRRHAAGRGGETGRGPWGTGTGSRPLHLPDLNAAISKLRNTSCLWQEICDIIHAIGPQLEPEIAMTIISDATFITFAYTFTRPASIKTLSSKFLWCRNDLKAFKMFPRELAVGLKRQWWRDRAISVRRAGARGLLNSGVATRAECTVTHIHSLHRPTLYEWTLLIRSLETVLLSRSRPSRDAGRTESRDPVGYLLNIPKARPGRLQ